jgi:hypothetical protein
MIKITGLDELSKKLDELAKNAEKLSETKSASMTDILTPEFVSSCTNFANAEELFNASGFDVSSQAAFEAIPEGKLDAFIASVSKYSSWREMLNAAGAEWAKRQLGI